MLRNIFPHNANDSTIDLRNTDLRWAVYPHHDYVICPAPGHIYPFAKNVLAKFLTRNKSMGNTWKITDVLICHPATNGVITKSNMAAAIHYEHIVIILFRVLCMCNTYNSTDIGTLNSFMILFLTLRVTLSFKWQGQDNCVTKSALAVTWPFLAMYTDSISPNQLIISHASYCILNRWPWHINVNVRFQ